MEEKVGHQYPDAMDLYQTIKDDLDAGKKLPDIFFCVGNNDFLIESVDQFEEYLNSLKIYQKFIIGKLFYFILYLCTLEIAPYYFVYYWLTKN